YRGYKIMLINGVSQLISTQAFSPLQAYTQKKQNTPVFSGYKFKDKSVENAVKEDTARVKYIIATDSDKYKINERRMIRKIMNAASYAGVNPVYIACIVKRETHFCENIITSENGKGPMGLTSIAIEDLYERPSTFDSNLGKLVKKYGSLNKLFAAKDKNPSMKLGNLGEILYKYRNPEQLKNGVCQDFDLNLKVGAFVFKGFLKEQGNNLYNTFYRYNNNAEIDENTGNEIRKDYADNAFDTYQKAMKYATKLMRY
ncbi:hypothetical protein IJ596_07170, partial [bacterium]|nr:hypothetical protein [bacterium]